MSNYLLTAKTTLLSLRVAHQILSISSRCMLARFCPLTFRKLHLIVADALRVLYHNNTGDIQVDTPEYMGHLARLENDLRDWQNKLPALLKIHFDAAMSRQIGSIDDVYARQGVILFLRYNNCVILLHRPHVFAALGGQQGFTTVAKLMFAGSIDDCMQVSKDTLSTIQVVHSSINHLGAWWYTLHYSIAPRFWN